MPFLPTDVSGCKLWLKSDTGVYKDAGSTLAANNDTIQEWHDQSGNSNHFTQATAGNRATFLTGILNGFPAIKYDATRPDFFNGPTSAPLSGASAGEVFLVVKINADPPAVDTKTGIWNWSSSDQSSHYTWTDGTIYEAFGTNTRKTTVNPTPALTSFRVYNVSSAASNFKTRLDTTQIFSTATNTVNFRTGATTLGRSQTTTYNTDGQWVELIAYNKVLSVTERGDVHSYLNDRYALGIVSSVQKTAGATAVLFKAGVTKTATIAQVLQKTFTKTATVSSVLQKTILKTVAASAVASPHEHYSATSAVLLRTWKPTITVDTWLLKTISKTVATTAVLIHRRQATVSAVLSGGGITTGFQIQSVIKSTELSTFSIAAFLVPVKTFSIEAYTVRRTAVVGRAHALLRKTLTKGTAVATVLKKASATSTFSFNGVARGTTAKTAGITAVLTGGLRKTASANAYLLGQQPTTTQAIPVPSRIFEKDQ